MSETITFYTLDEIIKCNGNNFKLIQTRTDLVAGDGVSILPISGGYEIIRTRESGTKIIKRVVESANTIQAVGDTTIQAISLNKNTINEFQLKLAVRDNVNNLVSWTNVRFYIQFFGATIAQVGNTVVSTEGTPALNVNLILENYQVIIYVNGNGNVLTFKSKCTIETAQF